MATRRVIYRPDRAVSDDAQLVVRFGRDVDEAQALRLALVASPLYKAVPGFERAGALCVSAFFVADEADAVALLEDTTWDHYGLATVGTLKEAGYDVVGTDIEDDGELIPHSERHVDVVVSAYPDGVAPYDQLSRPDRRVIREQLLAHYAKALRCFDPRRRGPDQGSSVQ
ncbi:MAG: hypothetical protein ACRDZX_10445 [Acidimicrobiales bacterium]